MPQPNLRIASCVVTLLIIGILSTSPAGAMPKHRQAPAVINNDPVSSKLFDGIDSFRANAPQAPASKSSTKIAAASTDIGPEGGIVTGLEGFLINPGDHSQILASTFGNSVFKSFDGGLSWARSNTGLTTAAGVVVDTPNIRQDRTNPETVYAVAQNQLIDTPVLLFRSTNFGDTWTLIGTDDLFLFGDTVADFAIDPTTPNVFYVLSTSGLLSQSTDGGVTFAQIGNGLPADSLFSFTNIVIVPSAPQVIYVAGSGDFEGLYKSEDGGLNFNRLDRAPSLPLQVFPHPTDPNTFFLQAASGTTGIFRTIDGGATFSEVNVTLPQTISSLAFPNSFVAYDPRQNGVVYLAGQGGLFRSTDYGLTFNALGLRPDQLGVSAITTSIDPDHPEVIYVNTFAGNFKSLNGGRSFLEINRGFKAGFVSCMAFENATDPSLLVANNPSNTLLRTSNRGNRYETLNYPPEEAFAAHSIAVAPSNPNFIVASTLRGVFRSIDGGIFWERAITDTGITNPGFSRVVIDPANANNVYVTSSNLSNGGLYRSTDAAQTFARSTGGLPPIFRHLAIDPTNPQTILVEVGLLLFRSRDGGLTFNQIGGDLRVGSAEIFINPQNSQDIFLVGNLAIGQTGYSALRSVDGGNTFGAAANGLPAPMLDEFGINFVGSLIDPTSPARLFAWFHEGLFMTENSGQSWTLVDDSETVRRAAFGNDAAMAINPKKPDLIYLGGSSVLEVEIKH